MRRIALTLTMLAVLGAAGCNNSSPDKQKQMSAKVAHSVSGTVGLMTPRRLSPQTTMQIRLVDGSVDGLPPLAVKMLSPVGPLPQQFSLDFDNTKINPEHIYLVKVDLVDGGRTFSMPVQALVITREAPTTQVVIKLVANETVEEQIKDSFRKVEKNLGAYAISNGRQLKKNVSHGWQTFRSHETGKIVFVRENTDLGDKGFTSSDFAYKNEKPWIVILRRKASQNASSSEVMRASWNTGGKLILREHDAAGKITRLSDSDAAMLKAQAQAMLKLARVKSPAKKKRH